MRHCLIALPIHLLYATHIADLVAVLGRWCTSHVDTASKAAIKQFAKVLATELGPDAITVNTIQPGAIDTIGQRR